MQQTFESSDMQQTIESSDMQQTIEPSDMQQTIEPSDMQQSILLSPDCPQWAAFADSIPDWCRRGEGVLLHNGRNRVWRFDCDGRQAVAKAFRPFGLVKAIVYTLLRKNKARKSFDHAHELLRRGIDTPQPIACVEERKWGLIRAVYYLSGHTDWHPICEELVEREPYNRQMAHDFASFVAGLHEKGIVHHDLNNTNVLWQSVGEGYRFMLIDINRVTFHRPGEVPKRECLHNLTLFSHLTPMFRDFLQAYIDRRGWTEADYQLALDIKQRHDRHWDRKQAWKRKLRLWKRRLE